MNLLLEFNYFYEMLGQKGSERIARFLDIFPNLSPEMNELIARFLAGSKNGDQKEVNILFNFWPFSRTSWKEMNPLHVLFAL